MPQLPTAHEQRRLMYVAATRARRELWLSAPIATAAGNKSTLSPLVTELLGAEPVLESPVSSPRGEESLRKLQRFYPLQMELPDKLPFELADGWLELGVGDLALYASDPHDFFIQKVLKISQPFGPQLSFGASIHGAIQAYYEAKLRGEKVVLDELLMRLDELWSDRGYASRAQAELAHSRAHETIKRFFAREEAQQRPVLSTEQPVRFELPEAKLRLKGRLDATFAGVSGIEVRDFKTGHLRDQEAVEKRIKDSGSREAFQLRTYALAVEQLTGQPPAQVTLDYVVTGAEGSVSLTSRVLANHREKLQSLAERIRARDFAPLAASAFHQPAAYRYWGTEEDEAGSDK
jgi:ATP-dependent exoDNAse (exonuclease V) beta subunit